MANSRKKNNKASPGSAESLLGQQKSDSPPNVSENPGGTQYLTCPKCGHDRFYREYGAAPDGAPFASDTCSKCDHLVKWYDEWNMPSED